MAAVAYAATMEIASDEWLNKRLDQAAATYQSAWKLCRRDEPQVAIAHILVSLGRYQDALVAADAAMDAVGR